MHLEWIFLRNVRLGWRWVRQDARRQVIAEATEWFPTAEACREDARAHGYGAPQPKDQGTSSESTV